MCITVLVGNTNPKVFMPSILYQFRVNSDTDPFLFETLDNVPSALRSEFIRDKLKIGILSDADQSSVPAPSVIHDKIEDVLPTPTTSNPHSGGFSQREVTEAVEKLNADPLADGNTKTVLPTPSGLTPAEIIRKRKAEAAAKLRKPGVE